MDGAETASGLCPRERARLRVGNTASRVGDTWQTLLFARPLDRLGLIDKVVVHLPVRELEPAEGFRDFAVELTPARVSPPPPSLSPHAPTGPRQPRSCLAFLSVFLLSPVRTTKSTSCHTS